MEEDAIAPAIKVDDNGELIGIEEPQTEEK